MTVDGIVNRGLLLFAVVWQAAWLLFDPSLWPTQQDTVIGAIFISGVLISAALLAFAAWRSTAGRPIPAWIPWLNLSLLAATAIEMLILPDQASDGWLVGSTFATLTVGAAAMILPLRPAIVATVVTVVGESLLLWINPRVTFDSVDSVYMYPINTAAIGAGLIAAAYLLRRTSHRLAEAHADLVTATDEALASRTVTERIERIQRSIHDIVLNTLTAIARGGLQGRDEDVRRRAGEALDIVNDLDSFGSRRVGSDTAGVEMFRTRVEAVIADLRNAGVTVEVDRRGSATYDFEISEALSTAMAECLRNCLRHANAKHVRITVRLRRHEFHCQITDDGVGFDAAAVGFGLRHSVRGSMEGIGGQVEVTSTPGDGTTIELNWSARSSEAGMGRFERDVREGVGVFVPVIAVAFGLVTLASSIASWQSVIDPRWELVALGIYALLLGYLVAVVRDRHTIGGFATIVTCIAVPFFFQAQVASIAPNESTPWAEWGSEAALSVLVIVIVMGPRWAWIAALVTWVFTQGDIGELLRPGTGVLLAVALMAFTIRRRAHQYDVTMTTMSQQTAMADAESEFARQHAARVQPLALSGVQSLLQGIATGLVDPHDDRVRLACAKEERYLRSWLALDPVNNPIHAFALALANDVHQRGFVLDIDMPNDCKGLTDGFDEVTQQVRTLVRTHVIGDGRLTAIDEGGICVVRIVIELSAGMSDGSAMLHPSLAVIREPNSDIALLEVTFAHERDSTGDGDRAVSDRR